MDFPPLKMRRKLTSMQERLAFNHATNDECIEFREIIERSSWPQRRRRSRKSHCTCMMLLGATALIGTSTLILLASQDISMTNPTMLNTRRRLGITVVQPAPTHSGENPIQTIVLPDSVRDELFRDVANLEVDTSNLRELERFISHVKEAVQFHVSDSIVEALRSLHNCSSQTSAVWIRNLPVDPYVPPNPTDGSMSLKKKTNVAEAMLVGFGELTSAHIVGYSSETQYSNPWIHEGFPRNSPGGSALTKASDLAFHQDMSYHPKAPDILGLVGIREGHDLQVRTELIDNREVLETLPEGIVSLLRQPRFEIKTSEWVDSSFHHERDVKNQNLNGRVKGAPILTDSASLAIPVEWENLVGLDSEATWAVNMLKSAILEAPKHYIHFVPGDLLFFNNKRTLHARTPFVDLRFDGGDRVLSRAYFRKDLSDGELLTRMI